MALKTTWTNRYVDVIRVSHVAVVVVSQQLNSLSLPISTSSLSPPNPRTRRLCFVSRLSFVSIHSTGWPDRCFLPEASWRGTHTPGRNRK
jgi:hypothetical protein